METVIPIGITVETVVPIGTKETGLLSVRMKQFCFVSTKEISLLVIKDFWEVM